MAWQKSGYYKFYLKFGLSFQSSVYVISNISWPFLELSENNFHCWLDFRNHKTLWVTLALVMIIIYCLRIVCFLTI